MERLCYSCWYDGLLACNFRKKVEEIVGGVSQNPTFEDLVKVHSQIVSERVIAREKNCPHLNNIDPDYLGKNLL